MNAKTATTKGTPKKKIRPITVTIEGDLASSGSDEAKEHRLARALSELRQNDRGTASSDGSVTVTPRYSVQEWVELALEIDEEAMKEMGELKPFYREQLETNLFWFGRRLTDGKMEAGRLADYMECLATNDSPEMDCATFRMIVTKEAWKFAKDTAAALEVGMAAYLRTGIWDHINQVSMRRGTKIRKTA